MATPLGETMPMSQPWGMPPNVSCSRSLGGPGFADVRSRTWTVYACPGPIPPIVEDVTAPEKQPSEPDTATYWTSPATSPIPIWKEEVPEFRLVKDSSRAFDLRQLLPQVGF